MNSLRLGSTPESGTEVRFSLVSLAGIVRLSC